MKNLGWLLLLFWPAAQAECPFSCTLTWIFPDAYVNGDVLNASDIQFTSIFCDGVSEPMVMISAPTTQFVFSPGLVPEGIHPCSATITDVLLAESAQSNIVQVNTQNPPPKPPSNLMVQ